MGIRWVVVAAFFVVLAGCQGSEQEVIVSSVVAPPEASVTRVPEVSPTAGTSATAAATAVPVRKNANVPSPTPAPSPTPVVEGFLYDDYGFTLRLDNPVEVNVLGWTKQNPDETQGLASFEYSGTNVFVLWVNKIGATPAAMLSDTYGTLEAVQPDFRFLPVTEGELKVGDNEGVFGGFALQSSSGDSIGGGLIGTWVCKDNDVAMGLTVIGIDATTMQVRFNRLVQGIQC